MGAPIKSITEARENRLLLFSPYRAVWFTPDELEAENAVGRFRWSDENWQLRPVHVYLAQHLRQLERAQAEYDEALARVHKMNGDA